MKKLLVLVLSLVMLFSSVSFAAAQEVETIKVAAIIAMNACEDRDMIQAEVNRLLAEKGVGVAIEFVFIEYVAWGSQINLMLSDGTLDLFNCAFMDPVYVMADNSAIAPLDDLVNEYGQDIKAILGDYMNCGRVDGVLYATPKMTAYPQMSICDINAEVAVEAGVDLAGIHDYQTLTDALITIKAKFPEMTMMSCGPGGEYLWPQSIDKLGGGTYAYACLPLVEGSDDLTVVNYYKTEEFKEFLGWGRKWAELGFFRKDAINTQDAIYNYLHNREAVSAFSGGASVAIKNSANKTQYSLPIESVPMQEYPWATTDNVTGMAWCIPALSEHKEAAMKFLNVLYSDPDIANVIGNGIEGEHYVITEEGNITYAKEGQDGLTSGWPSGMGNFWPNEMITLPWAPFPANEYDNWREINETCHVSPALGFVFDGTNVVDEIAACDNVMEKYYKVLMLGLGDDAMLEDMIRELEENGVNDIIAEKQAQLDAWAELQK